MEGGEPAPRSNLGNLQGYVINPEGTNTQNSCARLELTHKTPVIRIRSETDPIEIDNRFRGPILSEGGHGRVWWKSCRQPVSKDRQPEGGWPRTNLPPLPRLSPPLLPLTPPPPSLCSVEQTEYIRIQLKAVKRSAQACSDRPASEEGCLSLYLCVCPCVCVCVCVCVRVCV